jgi:hypothetical protein
MSLFWTISLIVGHAHAYHHQWKKRHQNTLPVLLSLPSPNHKEHIYPVSSLSMCPTQSIVARFNRSMHHLLCFLFQQWKMAMRNACNCSMHALVHQCNSASTECQLTCGNQVTFGLAEFCWISFGVQNRMRLETSYVLASTCIGGKQGRTHLTYLCQSA